VGFIRSISDIKDGKMNSSNRLAMSGFIVSVCGVVVAICALGLSFYMGWLQKNNYEISVQPYITVVPTVEPKKMSMDFIFIMQAWAKGILKKLNISLTAEKFKVLT
jgi:hypothetical protein